MTSEVEPVSEFADLIDKWKAEHQDEGCDPLPFLTRCCEILDSASVEFHEGHPDPFDQRHPKLVVPGCRLAKVLTLLENCKEFNDTLTSAYLKTNASPKNVGRVVITSVKLALLARKGYRIPGLDTEEWVNVLTGWIIYGHEPLRTHATGLVDGHCVVKKSRHDKSIKLITTLLKRLWNYHEPGTYREEESTLDVSYLMENPLAASLGQCYTFSLLKCFGEFEKFLSAFDNCNALLLISRYLEMKSNDRVIGHALEFLGTLFCHNKAAIEFIGLGGIQKLIDIPVKSIGSFRVAMCLYNLACHKKAIERICHSSTHILRELIEYAVSLLDCSRDSGKSNTAMFFSVSFSYQNVLSLFDDMGGLRYLVNMICMTDYLKSDYEYHNLRGIPPYLPDFPYVTTHIIKPAYVAIRKYFEAHAVFKVRQLVKSLPVLKHKYSSKFVTNYEFATCTRDQRFEYFDVLRELAVKCDNFDLDSWAPVALFQRLGGVTRLLKMIEIHYLLLDTIPAQKEVCQAALDVLCCVTSSQSCQIILTQSHPDLRVYENGLRAILNFIDTFLADDDATFMDGVCVNSAIAVIANCTEDTFAESRDDAESSKVHAIPRYNRKREVKETVWEIIRESHGIRILLSLLGVTKPTQTADETRYFACKALVGFVEYRPVRDILPKLHFMTSKLLEAIILKPVLEDKKQLHLKFCNNLMLLLKRIVTRKAITLDADWKTVMTNVACADTRARYDNEDILLIIYVCLFFSGRRNVAASLVQEAAISPDAYENFYATPIDVGKLETGKGFVTEHSKFSECNHSLLPFTLDFLIDKCSKHDQSNCENPIVAIPPFSLFTHRRNKIEASLNILKRHCYRQGVYRGWGGTSRDMRTIYSRFRPAGELRSTRDRKSRFTAVAFSHNDDCGLILGDSAGNLHFPKAPKFEDRVKTGVSDSAIIRIEPSYAGDVMLLQSNVFPFGCECALLSMNNTFDVKLTFAKLDDAEFSKTVQDKIVVTSISTQAIIYDLITGRAISVYGNDVEDEIYPLDLRDCIYSKNCATFSYDDQLVLSNGCLWDVRKPTTFPVHRFDSFNIEISGVFHPNGFEVITNTEVWDMRNFELIQSVPALDQCRLLFNRSGNVMYAVKLDTEERPGLMSSFRTLNSSNYNQLGCISVKQQVYALALDDWDRNIAVVETPNAERSSVSVCRMYEVGMKFEDDGEG